MLVTDYDILICADVNGYPLELQRADNTSIVWLPQKNLVPVSSTTVPSSGIYVLYDPVDLVSIGPDFTLWAGTVGPQGIGVSGSTSMLDRFALWEFDNGKLHMIGSDQYLAVSGQTATPDVNRGAVTDLTGETFTLDSNGAGAVFPVYTAGTGSFRLGITVGGTSQSPVYYGPIWYNHSLQCDPDEYLYLYKVE